MTNDTTKKIAELNDLCRTAMGVAGRLVQTCGISALPLADQSAIRQKVEQFDVFTQDNDPRLRRFLTQRRAHLLEDRLLRHDVDLWQRRPDRPAADRPGFDDHACV
jgi:hypothetical protein